MTVFLILLQLILDLVVVALAGWALVLWTPWVVFVPVIAAYIIITYITEFVITEEELR